MDTCKAAFQKGWSSRAANLIDNLRSVDSCDFSSKDIRIADFLVEPKRSRRSFIRRQMPYLQQWKSLHSTAGNIDEESFASIKRRYSFHTAFYSSVIQQTNACRLEFVIFFVRQ